MMRESRRSFLTKIATGTGLTSARRGVFAAALGNLTILAPPPAAGRTSPNTVWQIGRFDDSSGEFNPGVDPISGRQTIDYTNPSQDPVYLPGKSDPSKVWFGFQPGSRNAAEGSRPHPFTVEFSLPSVSKGLYTLKVAVLVENPVVSFLEIGINGHLGRYHFHPKLNYAMGDRACSGFPEYASDTITIELPTHLLKSGANRLVLTAVDEMEGEANGGPGSAGVGLNSGIVYDALQLDHDPAREFEESRIHARVVPTVFYKMQEGRLHELVDVFVRINQPVPSGEIALTLDGWKSTQKFGSERAFGEYRAEFAVPEFTAPIQGEVSVTAGQLSTRTPVEISPARKWKLFVLPYTHLDIGFTDYQSKVAELQCQNIDKALDLLAAHPDFRLNLDGNWIVEQYLRTRSEKECQRFAESVQQNKISLPAQFVNILTGLPTARP